MKVKCKLQKTIDFTSSVKKIKSTQPIDKSLVILDKEEGSNLGKDLTENYNNDSSTETEVDDIIEVEITSK